MKGWMNRIINWTGTYPWLRAMILKTTSCLMICKMCRKHSLTMKDNRQNVLSQAINLSSNSFKCLWPVKLSIDHHTSAGTGLVGQWGKKLRSTPAYMWKKVVFIHAFMHFLFLFSSHRAAVHMNWNIILKWAPVKARLRSAFWTLLKYTHNLYLRSQQNYM